MIDTNVYVSRWPSRRLPGDDTVKLVEKLKATGVTQAWAGSFDGLLHRDMAAVNVRLAEECQAHGSGLLKPFGTINPTLPEWEDDLRRCHDLHRLPGIRLHPNYHGYKLDDPAFAKLLSLAAERKLLVQLAVRMEDPRTQHRLLQVPDVDLAPLTEQLPKHPRLKLQLLNSLNSARPDLLDKLIAAGNVFVEIAMLEGIAGITNLLAHVPQQRVLFGSYFPFFAFESAELKLRESALAAAQQEAIGNANAKALLDYRPD